MFATKVPVSGLIKGIQAFAMCGDPTPLSMTFIALLLEYLTDTSIRVKGFSCTQPQGYHQR